MIAAEVKYKKTGIEWIPEIPEHWEILKAKNIGIFDGSTVDKKIDKHEKMIRLVNYMDIYDNETFEITDVVDFMKVTATEHQIKNLRVNIGDVVFTPSSEVREDIGKSAVIKYESDDLLFSYHVLRLRFNREIDINFKKYMFNNKPALKYFSKNCKGSTRKILNRIDFKNLPVYLPPVEEQQVIANYLDTQSAKITHFIQTKQRFIELLKEQRQSIITHAVTKGIDENVKMKETVVGEIPEHWEVRRMKFLADVYNGATPETSIESYWDGDINWITPADFGIDKFITSSNRKITKEGLHSCATTLVPKGSIIVSTRAPIGSLGIAEIELCTNQGCRAIVTKNIFNEFLYYFLTTQTVMLNILGNGTTFRELSTYNLKNLKIPYPAIEEQKRIVEHIKTETKTLDIAISKAEREIELIKEYREAMIAEAVTGKMKL